MSDTTDTDVSEHDDEEAHDGPVDAPVAIEVLEYLVKALVADPDAVADVHVEHRAATATWVASSASGAGSPSPSEPWCGRRRCATASTSRSSSSTEVGPLLEVGRVGRPHGLRGEVMVTLTSTETSRVAPGSMLFAENRELVVVGSRPHQGKWIVAFAGCDRREDADVLVGKVLSGESVGVDPDPDALWVHELVGSEVVEGDGTSRGLVEAVQENPASDLLVLVSGALVPLTFLVGRDDEGRLVVDVPPGLFELVEGEGPTS